MRVLLTVLIVCFGTIGVFAQTGFTCTFPTTTDSCANNCTISVQGTCLNNDCCNPINITQSILSSNLPVGWSLSMCNPNGCFGSNVTSNTFILGPQSSDYIVFSIHAGANLGTGTVQVRLENSANSSDFVEYTITAIATGNETTSFVEINSESNGWLSQNFPNPASGTTHIKYKLPKHNVDAKIVIRDAIGRQVANHELSDQIGLLRLDENLLGGLYFYTLFINGEEFDTKRMHLIR